MNAPHANWHRELRTALNAEATRSALLILQRSDGMVFMRPKHPGFPFYWAERGEGHTPMTWPSPRAANLAALMQGGKPKIQAQPK